MDRQTLIQVLFESITDKFKVQVNQRVVKVSPIEDGVEVLTNSGLTVQGDILVGADGVHSTVRREMWRLAETLQPGYFPASISDSKSTSLHQDPNLAFELSERSLALVCEYACIFGISGPTGHFKGGDAVSVFRDHYSCFVTGGPKGKVYWFIFSGLDKPRIGKNIPRFTKEDEERLATKYKDVEIADGLFFADLYATKMFSVMTPLEEGVFEKWHFGRMITIGDAAHKVRISLYPYLPLVSQICSSTPLELREAIRPSSRPLHLPMISTKPCNKRRVSLMWTYQHCLSGYKQ
jgi:2-polyprenyl-6-methoxyphenol hydroxylase-like FAD-dependent oxidoreductase